MRSLDASEGEIKVGLRNVADVILDEYRSGLSVTREGPRAGEHNPHELASCSHTGFIEQLLQNRLNRGFGGPDLARDLLRLDRPLRIPLSTACSRSGRPSRRKSSWCG